MYMIMIACAGLHAATTTYASLKLAQILLRYYIDIPSGRVSLTPVKLNCRGKSAMSAPLQCVCVDTVLFTVVLGNRCPNTEIPNQK